MVGLYIIFNDKVSARECDAADALLM
jgi:hypothetical protein